MAKTQDTDGGFSVGDEARWMNGLPVTVLAVAEDPDPERVRVRVQQTNPSHSLSAGDGFWVFATELNHPSLTD